MQANAGGTDGVFKGSLSDHYYQPQERVSVAISPAEYYHTQLSPHRKNWCFDHKCCELTTF